MVYIVFPQKKKNKPERKITKSQMQELQNANAKQNTNEKERKQKWEYHLMNQIINVIWSDSLF